MACKSSNSHTEIWDLVMIVWVLVAWDGALVGTIWSKGVALALVGLTRVAMATLAWDAAVVLAESKLSRFARAEPECSPRSLKHKRPSLILWLRIFWMVENNRHNLVSPYVHLMILVDSKTVDPKISWFIVGHKMIDPEKSITFWSNAKDGRLWGNRPLIGQMTKVVDPWS